MKIAVFLPNWVGDAVMATPTLRALRRHDTQAQIVGVLRPYVAEVFEGLPLLDRVIFEPEKARRHGFGAVRFVRRLRRERFDLAVLLPNSFRTALYARLARIDRRVGLDRDGRRWLLTDPVAPKSRSVPHPVIDEYLRLAEHLGCTELARTMELATTPEDERQLEQFWRSRGYPAGFRRVVCLNPGGAYGAAKHWPTGHFGELARRIAGELNRTVLVLCGPADRDEARPIAKLANHSHVVSLADAPLSLGLTKAAIRLSELLVTTDSGPRHFAPPFNVPVITLFGPTHIAWSETFYPKAVHLQHRVDCGPCQKRRCPEGHHRCMRDLTANHVFHEVARLLARPHHCTFAA